MVARSLLLRPRVIIADEPVSMIDASLRATVIESLRDLNRRFGISLIYITHDLTTAYQLSENIVVLYRGSVAEAGDVERVVKEPEHPYTRLLIGSIPRPDPKHPWGIKEKVPDSRPAKMAGRADGVSIRRSVPACDVDLSRENPAALPDGATPGHGLLSLPRVAGGRGGEAQ